MVKTTEDAVAWELGTVPRLVTKENVSWEGDREMLGTCVEGSRHFLRKVTHAKHTLKRKRTARDKPIQRCSLRVLQTATPRSAPFL